MWTIAVTLLVILVIFCIKVCFAFLVSNEFF